MILIVAAGLALAITKRIDVQPASFVVGQPAFTPFGSTAMWTTLWIEKWISPWLVTLAGAVLLVRFRKPRPLPHVVWDQPGTLAAALGILALIFAGLVSVGRPVFLTLILLLGSYPGPNSNPFMGLPDILGEATSYGGTLILGSWLTLAISGRFCREPGWIDGLGVFVGSCWITAHLISWVSYRIFL